MPTSMNSTMRGGSRIAIANAVAHATGADVDSIPLTPERLMKALTNAITNH